VETLWQDLRYAARTLAKAPSFTVVAVLTLALGIGANTAIFSLINAALLRQLPYPHADRLAFLWQNNRRSSEIEGQVSYPNWADWRAQSHAFEDMAFFFPGMNIFGAKGQPERMEGAVVSTNFFSVMGAGPLLGRTFAADDELPGRTRIAVISYALWKSRFGADAHIVGGTTLFGDEPYQIVGVMRSGFSFPADAEIWIPKEVNEFLKTKARQYQNFEVVGRLRSDLSWRQSQADMDAIANRLARQYPQFDSDMEIRIVPLREQLTSAIRHGLILLWGAIAAVLLIACLNVGSLILARAAGRQKEIAIRLSLGATRSRIARQFLAESSLLAFAGAFLGLILASWAVSAVSRMNPELGKLAARLIDWRVFGYTVVSTILSSLTCGLLPVCVWSFLHFGRLLNEAGTGSAAPRAQQMRKTLIVAEIACTFILLASSGLLLRSLRNILETEPGFDTAHAFEFHIYWPHGTTSQQEEKARNAIYNDLLARFSAVPGVTAVGGVSNVLFPGDMYKNAVVIESQRDTSQPKPHATAADATTAFFSAMGIPLVRGRLFTPADTDDKALPVAVINQSMAQRYWPNQDPIGKRFRFDDPNYKQPWQTIIGVVGDIRDEGLEHAPEPHVYVPSSGYWFDDVVIRSASDPQALASAIRAEVRAVDKNIVVDNIGLVSAALAKREQQRQFNSILLTSFSIVALALAVIGIYGGISFWAKQRTQEIGIRMALGAEPKNIFALVISRGMRLLAFGLVIGLAGALVVGRVLSSVLFGVGPADIITLTVVSILLAAAAFAACYFPARGATRVDPMAALRYE
jgi:predicted permease